jgi:hypothetical protein
VPHELRTTPKIVKLVVVTSSQEEAMQTKNELEKAQQKAVWAEQVAKKRIIVLKKIEELREEWHVVRSTEKYEIERLTSMEKWFIDSYKVLLDMKWIDWSFNQDAVYDCQTMRTIITERAGIQKSKIRTELCNLSHHLNDEDEFDLDRLLRSPKQAGFIRDIAVAHQHLLSKSSKDEESDVCDSE